MSQPKQYEAASIEEALRAVSIDLGDDIDLDDDNELGEPDADDIEPEGDDK